MQNCAPKIALRNRRYIKALAAEVNTSETVAINAVLDTMRDAFKKHTASQRKKK